jgi:hypothetical protein
MALSSIMVPPDTKRDAKARELVTQVKTWHVGTLNQPWGAFEAGTVYRITRNGHRCNTVRCSCDDYRSGHICKHVRALVLWEQEQARIDVEIDEAIGAVSWSDLRASMPGCINGCGQLSTGRDGRCDDCGARIEREQRLAAGRRKMLEEWVA